MFRFCVYFLKSIFHSSINLRIRDRLKKKEENYLQSKLDQFFG